MKALAARAWTALLRGARAAFLLGFTAWLIGQIARDRWWWSGICFYIPSPLVAAALLFGALIYIRSRRRFAALLAGLAVIPLAAVIFLDNHWTRPAPPVVSSTAPLRIVHWNICNGNHGWPAVVQAIEQDQPDCVVLSEILGQSRRKAIVEALGSDWQYVRMQDVTIFSRGPLQIEPFAEADGLLAAHVTWQSPHGPLDLLIADIRSQLDLHRDPRLAELRRRIEARQPDIIVGDFNAPRRSRQLAPLPAGYRHAYDAAGAGWSYTFPMPCPLWAIDQCITGPRIQPLRYDIIRAGCSDHLRQRLEFAVQPPMP